MAKQNDEALTVFLVCNLSVAPQPSLLHDWFLTFARVELTGIWMSKNRYTWVDWHSGRKGKRFSY